jgi:SAM-dependent methyltransferase
VICPVCRSQSFHLARQLYDDRYAYPGVFELFTCAHCDHGFLRGEFSSDVLRQLYSDYYPRSTFDLDGHQPYKESQGFGAWLEGDDSSPFRWVPRGVRVLDIGCGFGESLGYYQSRGCDAYGVEADENIRRVAEKFGYKVHVGLFDPNLYAPDSFDYVTMGQVIEHVTDPVETLRGVARVLKRGGHAVLSTPDRSGWGAKLFGGRWAHWHAPYHLQLFSPKSMQAAAAQAGLVMERTATVTPSAWLTYQWMHLITRPTKGQRSSFWSPKTDLSARQKFGQRLVVMANRLKINHLITRLGDLIGVGDNRLYFLRKP